MLIMIKIYKTDLETEKTAKADTIKKGSWIDMCAPSEKEIETVCSKLDIDESFIRYALDYEEKARIDKDDDDGTILYIIDTPTIDKDKNSTIYSTMPLGVIFVRDDYIVTVSIKENSLIEKIKKIKDIYT